jgi:hypothetical protein
MDFDWSGLLGKILPSIIGITGGLVMNNQQVQKAKGEANDAKAIADAQYQTILENNRAKLLALQGGGTAPVVAKKSNTLLYVGLGVGGVLLIGTIILVARR